MVERFSSNSDYMKGKKAARLFQRFYLRFGWLIALIIVLLFALSLRMINYTGVLDYDVLKYAYRAYDAAQGNIQLTLNVQDINFRAALYIPIGFFYWLFGPSEFSTVLYSLLASLIGVTFIYGIGRLQANESAGLIAALIWAALPINVFLSTLAGPDEILASYTIAAVFFLLLGNKFRGKKTLYSYIFGISFAILGVFVKPSAVIVFVFVGIFFALKVFHYFKESILKWVNGISISARWSSALIGLLIALILAFIYIRNQQNHLLLSLFYASTDLSQLFILGKTQEYLPTRGNIENTHLFLVSAPLFVVATVGSIVKRVRGSSLPLIWAASQFLYFEWGSISTNPTIYAPFLSATNDRNTLFVFAPFAVLVGIYFAKSLRSIEARLLAALSMLVVIPMAWFNKQSHYAGISQSVISFAVMVSIIGSLIISLYLTNKVTRKKSIILSGLILITLVAFLFPTPPLHVSDEYWQRQINYRRVTNEAAQFFLENPDYPILILSGANARELNFLSNFRLGFSNFGVEQQGARIQIVSEPKTWTESAFIYLRDEINYIIPLPSDWWKVAEYDPGTSRPSLIYRVLSPEDAANEIELANRAVEEEQNILNLERLLGAGVNAGDIQTSVKSWSLLNQLKPGTYSLRLISPLVIDNYYENDLLLGENLLANNLVGDLGTYQIDPLLRDFVNLQTVGDETLLSIRIIENLGGKYGVYKEVQLEPENLFVFLIDVQSTTNVDLLRVMEGEIPDSHDYSDVYGEWEERVVIFITPPGDDNVSVRLDLLTVNKRGYVTIKNTRLYQVELVRP